MSLSLLFARSYVDDVEGRNGGRDDQVRILPREKPPYHPFTAHSHPLDMISRTWQARCALRWRKRRQRRRSRSWQGFRSASRCLVVVTDGPAAGDPTSAPPPLAGPSFPVPAPVPLGARTAAKIAIDRYCARRFPCPPLPLPPRMPLICRMIERLAAQRTGQRQMRARAARWRELRLRGGCTAAKVGEGGAQCTSLDPFP